MEKNLLYSELLNLPSLEITDIWIESKRITVICHPKRGVTKSTCPICQCGCETVNQTTQRSIRDLDISGREVWLQVSVHQLICKQCNRYFTEGLDVADLGKSYTHRMAHWI